jgi:hypothetical protein
LRDGLWTLAIAAWWGRRFRVCPNRADYQWGEDPLEQLMVRFDSWRADSSGNRAVRSLATKSTHGGRAIRRAVTRVKLEQASKTAMWMPTRRESGEGGTEGEEPGAGARQHDNHRAPVRSTGVVSTARRKGSQSQSGRPGMVGGVAYPERRWKERRIIWASERVRGTSEPG